LSTFSIGVIETVSLAKATPTATEPDPGREHGPAVVDPIRGWGGDDVWIG
jgi:hypothetical protein